MSSSLALNTETIVSAVGVPASSLGCVRPAPMSVLWQRNSAFSYRGKVSTQSKTTEDHHGRFMP